jgi:hypothetical protein
MNLKILRWLLAHREVLTQIIDAVKSFDRTASPMKNWELVDRIARLVIPVLSEEDIKILSSKPDDWTDDYDTVSSFALGAECAAQGFDWALIAKVLIPILELIIKALSTDE